MPKNQPIALITVQSPELKGFQGLSFQGIEHLSRPFDYTLTGSMKQGISNFEKIIGSSVAITLEWGENKRKFHGMVGSIAEANTIGPDKTQIYSLTIHPAFWFLQHHKDCRIFRQQTALDIGQQILGERKVTFRNQVKNNPSKRDFCVQYNETARDFVSRLLEESGIFYYFTHSDQSHTMVLTDDIGSFSQTKPAKIPLDMAWVSDPKPNFMRTFQKEQVSVSEGYSTKDFVFQTPEKKCQSQAGKSPPDIFHYPGNFPKNPQEDPQSAGDNIAKRHFEAQISARVLAIGRSTAMDLAPGKKFTLMNHPISSMNKEYHISSVEHFWAMDEEGQPSQEGIPYYNRITAIPNHVTYRPLEVTPKPHIHGIQTAIVTGPNDKEIWTDEYGRITIKFHWDKTAEKTDNSSCWVRVATPWAGQGWGFVSIPRIGQEVLVVFLEGNPDRPLVIGSVYNGLHKPPYPDTNTKSTWKSHSTPQADGFNEIRFEDKKEEEELYVHAQKHARIEVEDSFTQEVLKGSHTTIIHRGDRHLTLKGEKDPTCGQGDDIIILTTGSHKLDLQAKGSHSANHTVTLAKGDSTLTIQKGNHQITLNNGDQSTTLSRGNLTIKVSGSGNITIETTGTGNINLNAAGVLSLTGQRGVKIASKLDMNLSSQTGMTIKGEPLVQIKGSLIKLN